MGQAGSTVLTGEGFEFLRVGASLENERIRFRPLTGDYKVEHVVGSGWTGEVKLGICKSTNQKIAIKSFVLKDISEANARLLKNEVKLHLAVDHPSIAKVMAVYVDTNGIHLVTEFCPGRNLKQALEAGGGKRIALGEDTVRLLCRQMFDAVRYLHERKVVHRDLKLENFLCIMRSDLEENGGQHDPYSPVFVRPDFDEVQVKMIDFGFAHLMAEGEKGGLHGCMGTAPYIPPEMLFSEGSHSFSADMWSLGVIVYHLLSGRFPFYGQRKEDLFRRIARDSPQFAESRWSRVSPEGRAFVRSLLYKDPSRRLTAEEAVRHPWLSWTPPPMVNPSSREASLQAEAGGMFMSDPCVAPVTESDPSALPASSSKSFVDKEFSPKRVLSRISRFKELNSFERAVCLLAAQALYFARNDTEAGRSALESFTAVRGGFSGPATLTFPEFRDAVFRLQRSTPRPRVQTVQQSKSFRKGGMKTGPHPSNKGALRTASIDSTAPSDNALLHPAPPEASDRLTEERGAGSRFWRTLSSGVKWQKARSCSSVTLAPQEVREMFAALARHPSESALLFRASSGEGESPVKAGGVKGGEGGGETRARTPEEAVDLAERKTTGEEEPNVGTEKGGGQKLQHQQKDEEEGAGVFAGEGQIAQTLATIRETSAEQKEKEGTGEPADIFTPEAERRHSCMGLRLSGGFPFVEELPSLREPSPVCHTDVLEGGGVPGSVGKASRSRHPVSTNTAGAAMGSVTARSGPAESLDSSLIGRAYVNAVCSEEEGGEVFFSDLVAALCVLPELERGGAAAVEVLRVAFTVLAGCAPGVKRKASNLGMKRERDGSCCVSVPMGGGARALMKVEGESEGLDKSDETGSLLVDRQRSDGGKRVEASFSLSDVERVLGLTFRGEIIADSFEEIFPSSPLGGPSPSGSSVGCECEKEVTFDEFVKGLARRRRVPRSQSSVSFLIRKGSSSLNPGCCAFFRRPKNAQSKAEGRDGKGRGRLDEDGGREKESRMAEEKQRAWARRVSTVRLTRAFSVSLLPEMEEQMEKLRAGLQRAAGTGVETEGKK
uniref:Protein kinase domain-containing protein n=1 Tax=Chromera velia CCMP2878 TaxID=1169474 RepID=A0A0G4F6V1_9ALVE|eukprot:Cvel_2894.t1-p1 / transcript=Cvel_2894.t1 / gene=Cvel_2894 / organism=Chromera_velia_CCMP2878 / gene_product=Calcium-dependent protein kinase 2, putative / transcript_product=Calcium-dependent protein kinase 2, putative / location=Cvel_scaffold114:81207-85065(-) / protein_length=1057 / sequence_SO=supercontig / SO=protein_coding / is_pseudo=false